jgi:hypothetical protein
LQAIRQGDTAALSEELARALAGDVSPAHKVLGAKLQAILGGARDPALAADPALDYADAVEVELLLEVLNSEF